MKDKRRLQLRGTDDAYARKDAAREAKQAAPESLPETDTSDPRHRVDKTPIISTKTAGDGRVQKPARTAQVSAFSEIRINYRLNLGEDLSHRLLKLAAKHDQPLELIMKAARNRAVARFKILATGDEAPSIPTPKTGGQVTRLSTVFTGEIADNLNRWFDPLKLDAAKDRIKPIILDLFQQEAQAICDAAD